MDQAFVSNFKNKPNYLDLPSEQVSQYAIKKKYQYMSKAISKIERQYASHKSLVGINISATGLNKALSKNHLDQSEEHDKNNNIYQNDMY
jgi:hypothetical protein